MREITNKERKAAGNIYCDHCKPEKVDAVFRKDGYCNHQRGDYACNNHKQLIKEDLQQNYTEADYETWLRL